jgi:Platelet-activating factor acetylhydrolase, isoform II
MEPAQTREPNRQSGVQGYLRDYLRRTTPVLRTIGLFLLPLLANGAAPELPAPTGPHSVGRTSFDWVDADRTDAHGPRELLVYVWYPAATKNQVQAPAYASYLPGAEQLKSSAAARAFANLFGPNWPVISSGGLPSHSLANVAAAGGEKFPILIFSPGGGGTSIAYTTQLEDLASYGYLVAGIEHTLDAPGVVFPDGRVLTASDDYWAHQPHDATDPDGLEKAMVETRAADIRFVIGKLAALQQDGASLFHSRLKLDQIGVFGHSRGGRAAARACQLDKRVKGCLNEDGTMAWQPFWPDASGRSMDQPFMMLDHLDAELPDEVFKRMGATREQYAERRSARQTEAREKLYGTVKGGSYHVTIQIPGISHNSFSDSRLLGRLDSGGINSWPEDVRAATPNAHILSEISRLTRAFFDKTLRGMPAPALDSESATTKEIQVERFRAAANRKL